MSERLDYQKQAPALFKKLLDYSMARMPPPSKNRSRT